MSSKRFCLGLSFLLFFAVFPCTAKLVGGYYITASGDTVRGKIEVSTVRYFPDSVNAYSLQYQIYFADTNGKVFLLRPGKSIREVGYYFFGSLHKLHCLPRKAAVGNSKVRKTEYIFLPLMIHAPLSVYSVTTKRLWGLAGYNMDITFYLRSEQKHVRWKKRNSTIDFVRLAGPCAEAADWARGNGIFSEDDAFAFVMQYNKYCGQ